MKTARFPRSAGILLHPTSLPGPFGIGDLGVGAYRFVDWLHESGMTLWQVLPLVPPGAGDSPYSSYSALSGNPWLIDPVGLRDQGLLQPQELDNAPSFNPDQVDFGAMHSYKRPLLCKAADRLLAKANPQLHAQLERFRHEQPWVEDAALFAVLRRKEQRPWWQWSVELRDRQPTAMAAIHEALRKEIDQEVALQFLFDHQWQALHDYCRKRRVRIMGDVPIYVDRDSVDVWARPEQFQLDKDGRPLAVAGVPPDFFSETGQLWGNPIYDWKRMHHDGYAWWIQRLRRVLAQVDLVRLDHFRGFSAYWSVPPQDHDARRGSWVDGPKTELFAALEKALGDLPLVAEDLGEIDQPVHDLREHVGLPGMKVLQFAFGGKLDDPFLPHRYEQNYIVYTGTHDNDTTLGWWLSTSERVRDHVRRYLARDGHDVVWDLIRLAFGSVAHTAVVPMQDVLTLDGGARMNRPGLAHGNWGWRVRAAAFDKGLGTRLRELCALYGRLNDPSQAQR